MQSKAATVQQYLADLPDDRRAALSAIRAVILKNLDRDYAEGVQYGMIGYFVPHSVFPAGYHCDPKQPLPFAALASQKNYMSIYLMGVYGKPGEEAWLRAAWGKTGKKLDMGKSCIRFKNLAEVPLEVIGEAIRRLPAKEYVAHYEANRPGGAKATSKTSAKAASKTSAKAASKTSASASKTSASASKTTAKASKATAKASGKTSASAGKTTAKASGKVGSKASARAGEETARLSAKAVSKPARVASKATAKATGRKVAKKVATAAGRKAAKKAGR